MGSLLKPTPLLLVLLLVLPGFGCQEKWSSVEARSLPFLPKQSKDRSPVNLSVFLSLFLSNQLVTLPLPQDHGTKILMIYYFAGYSNVFATLGVVCKCCDGAAASGSGENCATSWAGACSNLQCLPWKLQK